MMQDLLIIRRQIESIQHSDKLTSMIVDEWRSLDEIPRSTIRMHPVKNVYFNMAKDMMTFTLWEKLQAIYEKQSSSSKLIFLAQQVVQVLIHIIYDSKCFSFHR